MVDVVVDASALAALVFHEPEGLDMLERFEGVTLRAPELLDYEMANICVIKQRRHPDQIDSLALQFKAYGRLDVQLDSVDIEAVRRLATSSRLTAYDAAYLWLARTTGCSLITLDKALARAYALVQ